MKTHTEKNPSSFLPHLVIVLIGAIFVLAAMIPSPSPQPWAELFKTLGVAVGTTMIASSIVTYLYHAYGSSELTLLIEEIETALAVHKDYLHTGIRAVYRNRRSIPGDKWTDFVRRAEKVVWLYGMAEYGYAEDEDVPAILSALASKKGSDVRVLLLNPDSYIAGKVDKDQGGDGNDLPSRIRTARGHFVAIPHVSVRLYDEYPQVSIVRADDQMLITHYLRYKTGSEGITLLIQDVPGGVFATYEDHFRRMFRQAGVTGSAEIPVDAPGLSGPGHADQ